MGKPPSDHSCTSFPLPKPCKPNSTSGAPSSQPADCNFCIGQSPGADVQWLLHTDAHRHDPARRPRRCRRKPYQPRAAASGDAAIDWKSLCLPHGNTDGHGRAGAQRVSGSPGSHVNRSLLQRSKLIKKKERKPWTFPLISLAFSYIYETHEGKASLGC